jgi:hypothetical protein
VLKPHDIVLGIVVPWIQRQNNSHDGLAFYLQMMEIAVKYIGTDDLAYMEKCQFWPLSLTLANYVKEINSGIADNSYDESMELKGVCLRLLPLMMDLFDKCGTPISR